MSLLLEEYLTAQFYTWEQRGRGWNVFDQPVELEAEFIPFFGHFKPENETRVDYGKRPRFFPGLQEALGIYKKPGKGSREKDLEELEEMFPIRAYTYENENPVTEFQVNFDKNTRVVFENIEQLLLMLSTSGGIVGFEILGTKDKISVQFVSSGKNPSGFKSYFGAYAPGVVVNETPQNLERLVDFSRDSFGIDLGLRDEFMRPLRVWNKFDPDPLSGCVAALESLADGEFGMLQILFQSAVNPWAESIYQSVTNGAGGAFFADSPDMLPLSKEKVSCPLYACVIRTIGQAQSEDRAQTIAEEVARSLISFHRTGSNTLIPLKGKLSCDAKDVLMRRSRRLGMLLNSNELASLVHIPDRSVTSPKLRAYTGKTKSAPVEVTGHSFEIGTNIHLGQETPVSISDQQRLRHMHVIGATGTGKSSLLLNLIVQDIEQGRGIAVLDPHGDLIDAAIKHIPEERLKDVILVDPGDNEYPIGLNLLSAHSDVERIVLSSDMVALFRRFATSWGDQMTSVLSNAINAILESKNGGTFIDLRRFLVETGFRNRFLETVEDPNVVYYWKNEFQLLKQNSVTPILTRLDTFLRPRIIRNMMAQKEGLDFADILNSQKIFLVKLAQGSIGEENSFLLGTLFVAKLHQAAQSRQNLPPEKRTPFYFYIDEFQNFITPSMSAILSGARKYGLGLILAHQDLDQLASKDTELANSVLSNPAIRVCFRCGDKDAGKLEGGFSYFDATDLQSLGIGQAVVRVGQKDHDFNLSFTLLPKVEALLSESRHQSVIEHSRSKYALHHSKVDEILKDTLRVEKTTSAPRLTKEVSEEKPIVETKPEPPIIDKTSSSVDIESEARKFVEKEVEKEKIREHRFIQEFVKSMAEARNFKAVLEEPVNDYTGKVDVSLLRDDLKIACEISVTNTPEYEVQNIQKCFTAGFSLVFMISNDQVHLNAIRTLAVSEIADSFHNRLFFVSKDDFVSQLDLLLVHQTQPTEVRAKGYRVKLNYTGSSDASLQQKTLKDVILSSMRRKDEEKE
ncbi:MAG: type IV secretion system DNA-binding domain-containing protein [Saprospiraceae bacterium]